MQCQECIVKRRAIDVLLEPSITVAASGGLAGFLVGYFIRKIMKVILFVLGGVLSLIMYLQYQQLITVNVNKVQDFIDNLITSITNSTTNIILHSGSTFSLIPIGTLDPVVPFTGSQEVVERLSGSNP